MPEKSRFRLRFETKLVWRVLCLSNILATLFACTIGAHTLYAQSRVDQIKVTKWVLAGLLNKRDIADTTSQGLLAVRHPPEAVRDAWVRLKSCRDAGNSLDLNLAAAEHYLFMRWVASAHGDIQYRALPRWYETIKRAASRAGLEALMQDTLQPVSPPNEGVAKWGELGVEAGLADYGHREHKEPTTKSIALITAAGTAYTLYSPYKSSGGASCTVRIR